ncbi:MULTISPECIES: peptidoglycan-binding protein [unclassified Streptomyces]|jgi:peptidoglycan hydrolase-like protein with peptidoglycan-binding domain|uniref:peptidoglycan-binding domain-containing protein n=1 Tax=unclassified Streptomyces TaxID=2593676 RepID=UPI00225925C4|nr:MULTISPECIES: peptidoglycan-binding domain-containing protein [unclassified Streptomyces]MCX4409745.1 peptidoglycan-binding protein [Streptomyces sp. NBC_01764]MCX5191520.1 peptidoglycan-binding protein [Streptomyces sp. NBC_00268]
MLSLLSRAALLTSAALLGGGGLIATAPTATAAPAQPHHFTCTHTTAEPQLSVGSTGAAVMQAQCQLNSVLDRRVVVDGDFGSATKSATVAFQQCAGLLADGIIGPATWSELDRWWLNDIDCHK